MSRTRRWHARASWASPVAVVVVLAAFLSAVWNHAQPAQRLRRGLRCLAEHDWESLQYVESSLPATPQFICAKRLFVGARALDQRQFATAHRNLRLAARDAQLQPYAWLLAGEALYAQQRFREAEINFHHALKLNPNLVEAHRWLAIAFYDVGLMTEALAHLRRVAELDPRDGRPHRVIGLIHMDVGSFAVAVEDYQESLRRAPLQPDRDEILTELAACQLAIKRYDEADETLLACPVTSEVLAMRAEAHYALGNREVAHELARRAVEQGPPARLAYAVLGKLALDDRRYVEAIDLLTKGIEAAPSDYDLQYTLVTALRAAGRKEEAAQRLADAEALRKLREQYEELLQTAVEERYDADVRYRLGLLANQIGLPDLARTWMKAAVTLDPSHALAAAELRNPGSSTRDALLMLHGG